MPVTRPQPAPATISSSQPALSSRRIVHTWWPLAASWLLMTAELPLMSAVIARLVRPEINLAAWGIDFALATILQAPTAMLLAASTALSKDTASYLKLRRFMLGIVALVTAIHALIAFTPLYYVVVGGWIGVPAEVLEPARFGLMIMTPWSAGTAYRRFQQGVLIRFGHSRVVVWGSILRVSVDTMGLAIGYLLGSVPGVIVATCAIIAGVLSEAVYAGLAVRPVRRGQLQQAPPVKPALTFGVFLNFYVPLALTAFLMLALQPLVSAALSRMPDPLQSLAVWPVVYGLLLMWQSVGLAYNEVVIALLDAPQAVPALRRFTAVLVAGASLLLLLLAATPLASWWFGRVAALPPELVPMARQGLWLALLLPAMRILQSWFQGVIVYSRATRSVTEAVVVFLLVTGIILWLGATFDVLTGLYVGLAAFVAGFVLQTAWLWRRSFPAIQAILKRDAAISN